MALQDSNTYIEPTAGTSLNASRTQFNNSLRSLLTNFRSSSPPATVNISASGEGISVPDGTIMHFANSNVNALFVSDAGNKKSSPIGGNFTRSGIGHRNENGITVMMANAPSYEIGELATTVTAGATAANARLYLVTANNRTAADFIDVGIPPTNGSVVNTMIAISGVTSDRVNLTTSGVSTNNLTVTASTAGGGKKWFPEAIGVGHAALKVSSLGSSDNTAILFNFGSSSSNVSLAHQPGVASTKNGLNIVQQDGTYAPIAANVVLSSAITGSGTAPVPLLPAGVIVAMAGTVPTGWLECNGQAVTRTTYAALFAVTGTVYGAGNGSTTFNVPNFESKVLIGESSTFSLGPGAGAFASGGTITTASGSAALSLATTSVATSAKDSSTAAVISGVTAGGHTHTAVVPHAVARYMIKT
jgi:microcystin-dependent protein